nr:calreticulin-3-like [Tanacetum cinerariifolium]
MTMGYGDHKYAKSGIQSPMETKEFEDDPNLYVLKPVEDALFLPEVWQVKVGAVFDNILICDDPEYAEDVVQEVFTNIEVHIWLQMLLIQIEILHLGNVAYYICGFELDGRTWSTSVALHRSFHIGFHNGYNFSSRYQC